MRRAAGIALLIIGGMSMFPVFAIVAGTPGPGGPQHQAWEGWLAAGPLILVGAGLLLTLTGDRSNEP